MSQDERPLILVTGSSGLLGCALIDDLRERYEVVGMDVTTGKARCAEIDVDLTATQSIEKGLERLRERYGPRIAAVIHLAAYFDFSGEPHRLYDELNVEGTRRLIEALQAFDVERFIYAGSMLVHRPGEPGVPIDEDAPIDPAWAYPESKAAAEGVLREHRGEIPCTILRLAGAYSDTGSVPTLTHQIQRIYEHRLKGLVYAGDPARGQAMVHIDDAVDAFARAVERRDRLPDWSAYLIGEPETVGYKALQNLIADRLHGERGTTLRVPAAFAKAAAWLETKSEPVVPDAIDRGEKPFIRPFMIELANDHYELDISRARTELEWWPERRLKHVLPAICDALKEDPISWYRENGLEPPPWLEQLDRIEPGGADRLSQRFIRSYREAHGASRWTHFMNLALAAWLVSAPPTLGYDERAMILSDSLAGLALAVFALVSLSWRLGFARWLQAAVGAWLLFAPLLFWTDQAAAYANGTLVGGIVIGLAVALRPVPGAAPAAELIGPEVPPGWTFSPSSWTQRLPIIVLAVVGLLISRYLATYQLEHIPGVWEPFFGGTAAARNGTEEIITSSVSRAWPVPDAGVGALTYMLEILTGLIGSRRRWRTMPWLVMLFGIMIVPLGAVSIFFIVIQPIVIGTWCTLCLVAAAAMLLQIPYSLDELVASTQFLIRRKRAGRSLLRVFLRGDTDERSGSTEPRLPRDEFDRPLGTVIRDCLGGGVNLPWNLVVCIAIGIALMFTRLLWGAAPPLAHADHLLGALIVTISVSALAEVARPVRAFNLLLGAAVMASPWMFGGSIWATSINSGLGLAVIGLSLRRGPVQNRYGAADAYIV